MPLQRVPINNFRGGLNTRDSPFELMPNESPDLLNVTISALVGQLQMRAGKTRYDVSGMPAVQPDNAKQIVLGTSIRFLMLSINGKIYSCDISGNVVLRFTGTAGTVWSFEQYADATGADKVWCFNGTDTPQKWDGVAGTTSNIANSGVVPNGNVCKVWRNRFCIAGVAAQPQRLYFSPFGDPEGTTATPAGTYGFIDVRENEDELDAIQDLAVLGERLYLLKRRSVSAVFDPVAFNNRRIGEPGVYGRFQTVEMEEKLYFFNAQGIWSTGGVAVTMESGSINNYFPNNVTPSAMAAVRLMATKDTYPRLLIALPVGGSTSNNRLIEMIPHINFRRIGGRRYLLLPAFMLHTFAASALAPWNPTGNVELIIGGDPSGKLYKLFSGTTDDGTAITSYWKSAWMAIQGEEPFERIRRVNVELSGDAIVDIFKDFNGSPDFSATLPNPSVAGDTLWAGGVWDGGTWDPPSSYRFARLRPESRGRFHQLQFRSLPGGQPFLINVAEFAIRGGKEH